MEEEYNRIKSFIFFLQYRQALHILIQTANKKTKKYLVQDRHIFYTQPWSGVDTDQRASDLLCYVCGYAIGGGKNSRI